VKKNKNKMISPCVSVCRLSKDGICEGCGRTKKEIREWIEYSDKKRTAIMKRLPAA
jgi:predicted Fe-S protein YdhL (DUF1289 family)